MDKEKLKVDKVTVTDKFDNFFMLSDTHFGYKNGSDQWRDNMEDYFRNWFIPFLKKNKNSRSVLFVLGDIFDDRKSTNIAVNDLAIDIFEELVGIMPVYIINGNHDLYKKSDNSITSLRTLSLIKGITVFWNPTLMTVRKTVEVPSGAGEMKTDVQWSRKLMFIPYQGDNEKETDLCNYARNADYIFMHTDIRGLHYANGMEITGCTNVAGVKGKVYSGHIHKREETKRATYVGSPYQMDRADTGNQKGIYRVFLEPKTEEFYENHHSPVFQVVLLKDILDKPYAEVKDICRNNYTDIYATDEELTKFSTSRLSEMLDPCLPKSIEVKPIIEGNVSLNESDVGKVYVGKAYSEIIDGMIDSMEVLDDAKKARLKQMSDEYQKIVAAKSED